MRLIRNALVNYEKSNIAWSNNCFIKDTDYFQSLISLYSCSFDIFQCMESFYASFLNASVFIACVMYPLQFVFNIVQRHDTAYAVTTFATQIMDQLQFLACIAIANEFNGIHSMINQVYYKRSRCV